MDVAILRWPSERSRLERLREAETPLLLLVEQHSELPPLRGCLEDWIRVPASDADVRARADGLTARAQGHGATPHFDEDRLLRFRGSWVALSPVGTVMAEALVERFDAVVGREALGRRAWPNGIPTRNALDVHVLRLRRRVAELGLQVRTVRGRGYVLEAIVGGERERQAS